MESESQGILLKNFMKKLSLYLAAFAFTVISSINAYSQKDPVPPPPPPPPKPPKAMTKEAHARLGVDEFYKNNPSVSHIYAVDDGRIIIELRSGVKEKYNVDDETEKKNFVNKYGKVPLLPPPPPRPPKPTREVI